MKQQQITNRQAVKDSRCSWCQQDIPHMPDEHVSSIATLERLRKQR
jgi:hypothetical protein